MTGSGKNKKKRIGKYLLTGAILLLFIVLCAGNSWAQSRNARSDQAPDFAIGKLEKDNNWQVKLGDQDHPVPPNARLYNCNHKQTQFKAYMKGTQTKVIFKEIRTPEGELVKKVDKLYIICK